MTRIDLPDGEGREPLWALRPQLRQATEEFSRVVQECSILPVRVAEAARMRIAHLNGCVICREARVADMAGLGLDEEFYAGIADPAARGRYSEREALAIEFADRFVAGAAAFDDEFWERMRAAFGDDEIVDLTVSAAKWLGLGRINAVLDLTTSCPVRIPTPAR